MVLRLVQQFCRPGDLHVHYFGTATLSSDDIRTEKGDVFEIEAAPFVASLRNTLSDDTFKTPKVANVWDVASVPAIAKL